MTNYFNYELTGTGWARFSIVNENNIGIGFEFSYLANPLADLLSSLNKLHKNESSSERVNFPQEPGEIFLFIKNNNANLTLEIYYHNDLTYEIDDEKILSDFENIYFDKDTLSNFSIKVPSFLKRYISPLVL